MSPSPASLNDQQRAAYIREQVMAHGNALRQRYPILQHQDALGAGTVSYTHLSMHGRSSPAISRESRPE